MSSTNEISATEQAGWQAGLDEGRTQGRTNALIDAAHDGIDFDPNMNMCGRMTHKTIELVFACWDYRRTERVTMRNNATGLDAIRYAVEKVCNDLPGRKCKGGFIAELILFNAECDSLECRDDDCRYEEWLGEMLVSARIVDMIPAGTIADALED